MPDQTFHHHLGEWTAQTHLAVLHERQMHQTEIAQLQAKYVNQALILQKTENDLHFDRLNHEAAQLKEMQTTYLPREVYEADTKADRAWKGNVERQISNFSGRVTMLGVVLGLLFTLGLALIKVWK